MSLDAFGALYKGAANASADKYNAGVADQNEALAIQQGQLAQQQQFRRSEYAQGDLIAKYGAAGVDASQGSPLDVLATSIREASFENQVLGYNARLRALSFQNQGSLDRMKAKADRTSSYFEAGSDITKDLMNGGIPIPGL